MDLGKMVDVAIGLSLMYLVLSLFCTIANEYISAISMTRSKKLKEGLQRLAGGSPEFLALLAHPSIRGAALDVDQLKQPLEQAALAQSKAKADLDQARTAQGQAPADPAKKEAVTRAEEVLAQASSFASRLTQAASGATQHEHSYLSGQAFASAVLDTLNPAVQIDNTETYKAVMGSVDKLPDGHCKDVLRSTLNNASADLQSARDALAQWFDDQMEQVQGAYKRYAHKVSIIVGLVLAVALNADSLMVAKALWQDRSLGTQVADGAANVVATKGAIIGGVTAAETRLAAATDAVNKALAAQKIALAGADEAAKTKAADALRNAQAEQGDAEKQRSVAVEAAKSSAKNFRDALAPLPLGWPGSALYCAAAGTGNPACTTSPTLLGGLAQIIGLILTSLALGLGAPFWFDILSKAINIRSAGSRPATTTAAPFSAPAPSAAARSQPLAEVAVGQSGGTGG